MFNFVLMLILAEYSSITKCLDLKKTFGISQMFAFGRILKNSGSVILWTRYEEWKTCTISVLKPKDIELKSPFW